MRTIFVWCCLLAVFIEPCISDIYMHFPPGSNNRLNGNQNNVRNANRLFDSQVRSHTHSCLWACAILHVIMTCSCSLRKTTRRQTSIYGPTRYQNETSNMFKILKLEMLQQGVWHPGKPQEFKLVISIETLARPVLHASFSYLSLKFTTIITLTNSSNWCLLLQNNAKGGYNVGDKFHTNPGDNIQEFRQLPMVSKEKKHF